jgi:NodT family efflux transporter outer membrane factor (OMF) lipoprotein
MSRRLSMACLAAAAALALAACADMKGIDPQAKLTDAAALGLQEQPATPGGQGQLTPAADWWTALGDAQLNRLVAQALQGSPGLRAAAARVAKAQSAIGIARADDLPQVGGQLDAQRMRFQENYIYPPPYGGSQFNFGTLQLNGSWELDFFGKHSGALAAAVGQARAAEAERDAARVLLAANVVRAYVQWARVEDQRAVAELTLVQRQQMLQLVHERLRAGLDTQLEVRENETGRADSRTQITALAQQADAARNALAALLGQPRLPADVTAPRLAAFKALALPTELYADWLGRRADIVAARWRVEAARGGVEVAKSEFYPNINLVGAIGLQSLGFNHWLKSGSLEWNAGPAIRLPIFEGGRLRANLRGQTADLDAAIEDYNATVINAMRDAADQAQAVQSLAIQREQQGQALAAAEGAYAIAGNRYRAGLTAYLNVLVTETTVLGQRRQQVDLLAQSLNAQIGLAQAMGGGWQPTADETAPPLAVAEGAASAAPPAAAAAP